MNRAGARVGWIRLFNFNHKTVLLCRNSLRSISIAGSKHTPNSALNKTQSLTIAKRYGSASVPDASGHVQFKLSDIGEGIAECEVLQWYVKEGDKINDFDKICEVQSDKATVDITSPFTGTVTKLYYQVGDMAKVGKPLVDLTVDKEAHHHEDASSATKSNTTNNEDQNKPIYTQTSSKIQPDEILNDQILTTPAVRRIAKENNVSLNQIKGTGRDGRITKEDVINYIEGKSKVTSAPVEQVSQKQIIDAQKTQPSFEDKQVAIKGFARVMVKTMTSANQVPHFGYSDEYGLDGLVELRKLLKPEFDKKGINLSYLPFIIKCVSISLTEYPMLNAHTNDDCSVVTWKGSHNIGIAMDTISGLAVPNIKNVQNLSIVEIAQELTRLMKEGKETGKFSVADMENGTFTLSNVGAIGGTYAKPLLFLPQVVIGAIGKMQKLPRFNERNEVVPSHIMNFSWSADHRVVDGATMANFSNKLKNLIENPSRLIVELK